MGILGSIRRFFFQKATHDFDANEAFRRNQLRYNALYALDPDVLVRHLSAFERGDICGLERVLDEFELREDKMKIGAFKMAAAVSSKPWEVRIRKGGIRLLVKQMMSAQSRVYSVHDICWKVNGDGTLNATFTHVPAWCFENRTGRLRYIRNDGQTQGEEMRDGEWLVTVGEGVGIPSAILAMAKRLSWNDWLLFSEKCGMPVIIGKTAAQRGTPAWDQLARAIRAVAPKTGLVADAGSDLSAVSMGAGSGKETYRELVETVDRAISALYRGGDFATMSGGPDSVGVNAQDGESELMDADGCAMVSETLRDQVEKFVIRFECGDFEPLAEIVINPPAETEDVDREIKIDSHLAGLGVKLSKADALARYGRTEAADKKDALEAPKPAAPGPFGALPNEVQTKTPLQTAKSALQNAPGNPDGQGEGQDAPALLGPFLSALKDDCKPLADAVEKLIADGVTPEAAKELLSHIDDYLPTDPAAAAVLAEDTARVFAEAFTKARSSSTPDEIALANENPYHCPKCGKFSGFNGHCDKCGYTLDADETQKRAERLIGKAMAGVMLKPVDGLAFRDEIGQIDLEVGKRGVGKEQKNGTGLAKLKQKHSRDIHDMAETLAHGEIMPTTKGTKVGNSYDPDRRAIVHGNYVIFLQRKGERRWKISTHYKSANDAAKSEEIKQWLRSGDQSHLQGGAE